MFRRLLLAGLAALLFLSIPGGSAFAYQEGPTVACGDLSDEDCAFLQESAAAMQLLESHTAQVELAMSLTDLPSLPPELAFSLSTDSILYSDPELAAQMMAVDEMSAEELAENLVDVLDLVTEIYFSVAFDVILDLELSGDMADLLSAQAQAPIPQGLTLPFRLVDGYLYLNVDDLAAAFGAGQEVQGWLGVDVGTAMADAMQQAIAQMETGAMPANPAAAGFGAAGMQQNKEVQEAIDAYTLVERLEDGEVDGVAVAQFRYEFDLAGFLADPAFAEFASDQLKMMAATDPNMQMSEQDLQTFTTMLPMMAPMLLSGFQMETTSAIGLEDAYVYATETHVDWNLAPIVAMAAMGEGISLEPGAAPAYTFHVMATNADFNAAPPVEAPDDAIIIPLEAFAEGSSM